MSEPLPKNGRRGGVHRSDPAGSPPPQLYLWTAGSGDFRRAGIRRPSSDSRGRDFRLSSGRRNAGSVYGQLWDRDFDDALLEEMDIAEARGFCGIAAAAFIAPHTFSGKVAGGRPDAKDREAVGTLAAGIGRILQSGKKGRLTVSGNRPYKEAKRIAYAPQSGENCVKCGFCAGVCPAGAIDAANPERSDPAKCISCMACVKQCPRSARVVTDPGLAAIREKLETVLAVERKEAQLFFAE